MKTINLIIKGGLGNQLFQYWTGKSIAIRENRNLNLETRIRYRLDRKYKRKYELNRLNLIEKECNIFAKIIFCINILVKNLLKINIPLKLKIGNIIFINEEKFIYDEGINDVTNFRDKWMDGYWQSPRYFQEYSHLILEKMEILEKLDYKREAYNIVNEAKGNIENCYAIGIRIYEETINPSLYAKNGKIKDLSVIGSIINTILCENEYAKFYIFTTMRRSDLGKLRLDSNAVYINYENGYYDPIETLWMMSNFKNQIITNSTLYWWGAYLSSLKYNDHNIYAADNFLNDDAMIKTWHTF